MIGVTLRNPFNCHPGAFESTILPDGVDGIRGTGGIEPAGVGRKQRRNQRLVPTNHYDEDASHGGHTLQLLNDLPAEPGNLGTDRVDLQPPDILSRSTAEEEHHRPRLPCALERFKQRLALRSEPSPHQTAEPVALHGIECLARHRIARLQLTMLRRLEPDVTPDARTVKAPPRSKDTAERGMSAQSVSAPSHLFLFITDSEFPTALRPAPRKNFPAHLCGHPLAETVRVLPLSRVRLKRAFH